MTIRRDYTNGSGYICPAENEAIRNLDRPKEKPVTPRPYKNVLREQEIKWMPFARYRRGWGTNARYITNYCPHCGKKMTAMPMCGNCKYGQGKWKEDGICYACREQVWIPGAPHRKAGEEG